MLQYFSFCPFLADELWPGALGYLINAKKCNFSLFYPLKRDITKNISM